MGRHSFAAPGGPRPRFPGPLATEGVVFSPFRWPRPGPAPRRSGTRVDAGALHTRGRPTHSSLRDLLVPDPPPFRSSGSSTPGCRPMLASSLESASIESASNESAFIAADALAPAFSRESSPRATRLVPRRLYPITGLPTRGHPLPNSTDRSTPPPRNRTSRKTTSPAGRGSDRSPRVRALFDVPAVDLNCLVSV